MRVTVLPVCHSVPKSMNHHLRRRFDVVFVVGVQFPSEAYLGRQSPAAPLCTPLHPADPRALALVPGAVA